MKLFMSCGMYPKVVLPSKVIFRISRNGDYLARFIIQESFFITRGRSSFMSFALYYRIIERYSML